MAITFQSYGTGQTLVIGGVSSSSGGGPIGPFANFSIDRQELKTGDDTSLGAKITITITGTATITPGAAQDITAPGERQTQMIGAGLAVSMFNRAAWPINGAGLLSIVPYGGGAAVAQFPDAKIVSATPQEQDEQSSGVQYQPYTFVFEAFQDHSYNGTPYNVGDVAEPTHLLESAEERWEMTLNQDDKYFLSHDPTQEVYKTYTLTHTLSAVGKRKYESGGLADEGESWRQAQRWVKTRLETGDSIRTVIPDDLSLDTRFWITKFYPIDLDAPNNLSILPVFHTLFKGVNHVRQVNSSLGDGTYSVTETWLIVRIDSLHATYTLDIDVNDENGPFVTVGVSVNIQGNTEQDPTDETDARFSNAKIAFDIIKERCYEIANTAYTAAGKENNLRNLKISESYGENKLSGTITYSVSYNDAEILIEGAISEELNINDDNMDGENKVIAKIPIIGKLDGPVIQDMSATTIKSRSVNFDVVMPRDSRTGAPRSQAKEVVDGYKPTSSETYQQVKTEQWNPKTGLYNIQITWEYI